jgi:hypothetical protein
MSTHVRTFAIVAGLSILSAASRLEAASDLSGTYGADDGAVYYVQQSGSALWWAGMSLDHGLSADKVWHRGLDSTRSQSSRWTTLTTPAPSP